MPFIWQDCLLLLVLSFWQGTQKILTWTFQWKDTETMQCVSSVKATNRTNKEQTCTSQVSSTQTKWRWITAQAGWEQPPGGLEKVISEWLYSQIWIELVKGACRLYMCNWAPEAVSQQTAGANSPGNCPAWVRLHILVITHPVRNPSTPAPGGCGSWLLACFPGLGQHARNNALVWQLWIGTWICNVGVLEEPVLLLIHKPQWSNKQFFLMLLACYVWPLLLEVAFSQRYLSHSLSPQATLAVMYFFSETETEVI